MSWTKSGTVSLTNNSKIVYGSGTTWAAGGKARAGDVFVSPSGALYEVESIPSNTELHLVNNYLGATASGQGYALIHTGLLPAELAVGLSDLQSKYLTTIAQLYEWETSVADTVPITNPATGVTTNVKPLARFLASLGDGATDAVLNTLRTIGDLGVGTAVVKPSGFSKFIAIGDGDTGVGQISDGILGFASNGVERIRMDASGQIISTATDSLRLKAGGGQSPAVLVRNDGNSFYFLMTNPNDVDGAWNSLRPFFFNTTTGELRLCETGAGVVFGGSGNTSPLAKYVNTESNGVQIRLEGNGANGNRTLRLINGEFDLVNHEYTAQLFAVTATGETVTHALRSFSDNVDALGGAANRWSVVYAGSGSINTSDARLKTPVETLTAAELRAARRLADEVGTFRFLESVAEKGDRARMHVGLTVQRAIEIMKEEGLDPMAYGFVCYDVWEEESKEIETAADEGVARTSEEPITRKRTTFNQTVEIIDGKPVLVTTPEEVDVPVFEAVDVVDEAGRVVMVIDQPATEAVLDEAGNEVKPAREATYKPMTHPVPVMETVTRYYKAVVDRPAGDRYSFRYDELAMFICRGFADRLAALEAAP